MAVTDPVPVTLPHSVMEEEEEKVAGSVALDSSGGLLISTVWGRDVRD